MKAKATAKTSPKAASKPVVPRFSPNPMTNLIILDLVLRASTRALRHAFERGALGTKYSPDKAKDIVKGRTMTQSLIGTAVARVATKSVPGALLVGGGLLAKSLYDRRKSRSVAEAEGNAAIEKQVEKGKDPSSA